MNPVRLSLRPGLFLASLALVLLGACTPEPALPETARAEPTSGAEAPPEETLPAPVEAPPPLDHDDLEALRAYRAHLDELARYDDVLAELLDTVPTGSDALNADPFVLLDFLVRHSVPYVFEYVYPPYDRDIAEALRVPRELVSLPPIRDAASFAPARAALERLAGLADEESGRRDIELEAFERALAATPDDYDAGLQHAAREVELEGSRAMAAFLVDTLGSVVATEGATRVATVLEAMRALIEVASANDFEGADTTRRAALDAARLLRLVYGASVEELDAPELRVARVMARESR